MRHPAVTICVFASLALAVAGCGSPTAGRPPHATATTPTAPAPTTTAAPPSTTTSRPSGTTTVSVTGSGGTAETITIDNGGTTTHHDHVPLPYTLTLPASRGVTVEAQTGDGSPDATITCQVASPDGSSSTATSTGPRTTVTCG